VKLYKKTLNVALAELYLYENEKEYVWGCPVNPRKCRHRVNPDILSLPYRTV
jgi:hypothetical protein